MFLILFLAFISIYILGFDLDTVRESIRNFKTVDYGIMCVWNFNDVIYYSDNL